MPHTPYHAPPLPSAPHAHWLSLGRVQAELQQRHDWLRQKTAREAKEAGGPKDAAAPPSEPAHGVFDMEDFERCATHGRWPVRVLLWGDAG